MNTPSTPSEDPLERALRKSSAPIADDGFSVRVLAALPPPPPKPYRLPNRRFVLCSLGATTGLVWTLVHSGLPRAHEVAAAAHALNDFTSRVAAVASDPTLLVLGALVVASLIFAYAREIATRLG